MIAFELDIVVKTKRRPVLSDLKDSGSLEEDALYRAVPVLGQEMN